jgi:RNA polymerase sigma-70 factor (ECF subfamily)
MVRQRESPASPRPSEGHRVGLVRRLSGGSEAALEELYRVFEEPVYGLALRILRDEKSAEEATVEVFHRVWRRASTFDPERGMVLSWVMTITRSVALEVLRSRRREANGRLPIEDARELALDAPGPVTTAANGETAVKVDAALRALPREQERALRAAFFGGLSYSEVAEVLGQPIGTVKTRIRAGLAALRRALPPEGGYA